jgi:hypothetical protein
MISSRCNDRFPTLDPKAPTLSDIRQRIKNEVEAIKLFDGPAFEVWINEASPPQGGNWDSWEVCLGAVKDCDILLVLYNGNAGWAKAAGDVGICHDELSTAYAQAPGKIRLIALEEIPCDKTDAGKRNKRFQDYVAMQTPFRGGEIKTVEDLHKRVREALRDAVVTLTQDGVLAASKGQGYTGQALNWNRKSFTERQKAIVAVLSDAVSDRPGGFQDAGKLVVNLGGQPVCFIPAAIPAAFSVSAAREMVGQPFLSDHSCAAVVTGKHAGPVHIIGCHKRVTEANGIKLLGFPDATVVTTPFGVYVADNVQKIQLILIANCSDDPNTRHGVQRFFEWLQQTGEGGLLASRAAARARIVRQIAKEVTAAAH